MEANNSQAGPTAAPPLRAAASWLQALEPPTAAIGFSSGRKNSPPILSGSSPSEGSPHNTERGAAVDCRTRKQFPSLKSDFRVTVGGGGAGIDGILHAHTFCTTTPIILAITPPTTGGAANREQSGLSSREASAVTSQSSGCGLKIRGQTVRWQTSSVVARVGAIGPCCSATCHPGMSR